MTVTTGPTPGWPWPTGAEVSRGVGSLFPVPQRQGDVNRQVAISWVPGCPRRSVPSAVKPGACSYQATRLAKRSTYWPR